MRGVKKKRTYEKINYDTYDLSCRQIVQYLAEAVLLCVSINYLFYKNPVFYLIMIPVPFLYVRQKKKEQIMLRKQRLHYQFRDVLGSIQVGISSGYSLENALKEAKKDLERIYGRETEMVKEISFMETQFRHSVSVETLLYDLGDRSHVDDIINFSDILVQSKKLGGNMREVLQNCIASIEERIDVKKEIDAGLASRKLEQRIMSVVPVGIILYLQFASPEFLGVLYGNTAGICVMTICLTVYLAAYLWGARLVEIEV